MDCGGGHEVGALDNGTIAMVAAMMMKKKHFLFTLIILFLSKFLVET